MSIDFEDFLNDFKDFLNDFAKYYCDSVDFVFSNLIKIILIPAYLIWKLKKKVDGGKLL